MELIKLWTFDLLYIVDREVEHFLMKSDLLYLYLSMFMLNMKVYAMWLFWYDVNIYRFLFVFSCLAPEGEIPHQWCNG